MNYQTILTEISSDGCGVITLNRLECRNAISILMRRELSACLAEWRETDAVGCVIITGGGPVFSAGFDLDEFRRIDCHAELLESSSRYHRDLWHFPKPLIAAINGPAMGGGFDLACLCDIRLAAVTAGFGHPEIKFGAPPMYTPLRRIVGDGYARELCLTGRRIDADEALRIGLVTALEQPDSLMKKALCVAASIMAAPVVGVRYLKQTFLADNGGDFEVAFALEHDQAFREVILKLFTGG